MCLRRVTLNQDDLPFVCFIIFIHLSSQVEYTLACMQHDLLAKATAERDSRFLPSLSLMSTCHRVFYHRLTTVMEWKDFVPELLKGNMCLTPW